jgi:phage replication O-like protein O
MNQTANVIKFERPFVKADTDNGFIMLAYSINIELGKFGVYRLNGRERALIDCVLEKTFRWKKKVDWISESQFSEFMGLSTGSAGNINKIKNSLIKRKILISVGRKVGLNTILSEWVPAKQTNIGKTETSQKQHENQSNTTETKTSQKQHENQSNTTEVKSNTTENPVESDPHNRKNLIQENLIQEKIYKGVFSLSQSKPISKDFTFTNEMKLWAEEEKITVNLISETKQFIDHFLSKGECRADWVPAWRAWMRNSKKYSPKQSTGQTGQSLSPIGQSMAARLASMSEQS